MVGTIVVLLAAVKAVLTAALLFTWAALMSWKGIVDQSFLSKLSMVAKVMFLPCLNFNALASGVDAPFIRDNWLLVVIGSAILPLGIAFGHLVAKLVHVPLELRPWFVLSVAVPNAIALPLVLVESLCHDQESDAGARAQCIDGATTRLFTATLMHTFIFWMVLYPYAKAYSVTAPATAAQSSERRRELTRLSKKALDCTEKAGLKDSDSPAASKIEVRVECQAQAEEKSETENGRTHCDEPKPEEAHEKEPEPYSCAAELWKGLRTTVFDNPVVIASLLALVVAFVPELHQLLYSKRAALTFLSSGIAVVGKASPAVTNTVAGGAFGLQLLSMSRDDPLGLKAIGISKAAMAALVLSRIVFVPLLTFVPLLLLYGHLPRDPWSRLILFFQPAGTTANVVSLAAQLCDQQRAAKMIACATLPMMLLYIPMATFYIAVGMLWNPELH